jgi:hypothetical protein
VTRKLSTRKLSLGWGLWSVPPAGSTGRVQLEGPPPLAEEAMDLAAIIGKRFAWSPGPAAHALLAELEREVVGRAVVLQGWDDVMIMLVGDGPYPVRAVCRGVVTADDADGLLHAFLQLEDPAPVVTRDGYDGRGRYYVGPGPDGLYLFDVGMLDEIEVDDGGPAEVPISTPRSTTRG